MSFGNSSKSLPAPPQKPLGLDESRASTNEQARPVPYLAGKNRVGITWISDAFDIVTSPVTSSAGKGKTTISGYNYYASIAGLICHGPLNALHAIYLNSEKVWPPADDDEPLTREGSADYADLTISGYGNARLYWGTSDQGVDAILLGSTFDHPPYRGQAYIRFEQMFFGFNQTNAPNVELVVSRYPSLDWHEADVNVQDDCNPIAIIGEWLQNPIFGLGWSDDRIDTATLNSVAATLADEGIGLSPYLTKQQSTRQLIVQLCEYFDGYPFFTSDGKFSLGLIRKPEDVEALPEIDEDDLASEPDLDPESWRGAKNKTWIKYTNRDREFKEDALPYRDPGVFQITGDNAPVTIERPWVTRPNLAQKIVAAAGRSNALPHGGGKLSVLKSSATALTPGAVFRFTYAHYGISDVLLRVKTRSVPKPGARTVDLQVELDRAYLNDAFYVPEDDGPPAPLVVEPAPFVAQKVIELPRALAGDSQIALATLAARPNRLTTRFHIHLRKENLAMNPQPFVYGLLFLGGGSLVHAYPNFTSVVDKTYGMTTNITSGLSAIQSALLDGKLLASVSGREWMSVYRMDLVSDTTYRIFAVRARGLTAVRGWGAATTVEFFQTAQAQFTYSYQELDEHEGFAQHGAVTLENYPATTDLVDNTIGLVVTLDQTDKTLESLTLDEALGNTLLLLVDDEIISIVRVELLAAAQYRIFGIRGRYDTRAQAHVIGAEVWIMERLRLNALSDSQRFVYSAQPNFKLQPTALRKKLPLDQATPVEISITNRAAKPRAPLNLRAFTHGACHAATTSNLTLSGTQTIDGVPLNAGDRVLVKNQTAAEENGIYVCATGSWSRASDADSDAELETLNIFVTEGGTQSKTV